MGRDWDQEDGTDPPLPTWFKIVGAIFVLCVLIAWHLGWIK